MDSKNDSDDPNTSMFCVIKFMTAPNMVDNYHNDEGVKNKEHCYNHVQNLIKSTDMLKVELSRRCGVKYLNSIEGSRKLTVWL